MVEGGCLVGVVDVVDLDEALDRADGVPFVHRFCARLCATAAHSEDSETANCTERYSSQFTNNSLGAVPRKARIQG